MGFERRWLIFKFIFFIVYSLVFLVFLVFIIFCVWIIYVLVRFKGVICFYVFKSNFYRSVFYFYEMRNIRYNELV